MKAKEDTIKSVGLSILYEPDQPTDTIVDIVLVHGIGGHPVRSWKYQRNRAADIPKTSISTLQLASLRKRLRKTAPLTRSNSEPLLARELQQFSSTNTGRTRNVLVKKNSAKSSSRLKLIDWAAAALDGEHHEDKIEVYWPLDLLPSSCPNARILTFGYHTLVVDKKPLRLQDDIFAHARELLHELANDRESRGVRGRPILFVAHSTGGILVKELLRLSEQDCDGALKDIIFSTSAVVFLGCPHRATEHAKLGDAVRSMASVTLNGIDSNDSVLQNLSGATSVEVDLGRQAFIRIWNDYNFKVKTFQESLIPSFRLSALRTEATIRRLASFIGDPRENAETIGALHGDISKFSSSDDPSYQSLTNALFRYIQNERSRRHKLNTKETECLAALARPHFSLSETHPATSYPGTCLWLYDMPELQAWHHRSDCNKNKVLWIRGEPGCGKSILLRSLRTRLERQWGPAGSAFIWASSAKGQHTNSNGTMSFPGMGHETSSLANLYRSLLAQLFLQDPHLRNTLLSLYERQLQSRDAGCDPRTLLDDAIIVSFFGDYVKQPKIETPTRRTFIFVDVSDHASPTHLEEVIGRLSQLARNSDFSICVASAYHPELSTANAIDIVMHLRNADDLLRYINLNFVGEWEERNRTVVRIGQKAGGVFLWAEIIVNILNAAISEGATPDLIEYTLEEVPGDLHGLYEWMLATLNERERAESLVLFQWVILAAEPIRLNDLFVAIRLTDSDPKEFEDFGPFAALRVGPPSSMRELRQLRNSEITSDTPYQFHRWIRARSIGLLELKSEQARQGGEGEPLGLQRVQPIHDSVLSFFLSGRGFACLSKAEGVPAEDFVDISHYSLLRACLRYLNMRDFDHIGQGGHAQSPGGGNKGVSSSSWQRNVLDQRQLVMSSYPFLQYAVDNWLYHMLTPRFYRYFLPQHELFLVLSANRFRLWRRWTSLMGISSWSLSDPVVTIFASHSTGPVAPLLSPVYGAIYRLERVFRKLSRLSAQKVADRLMSPILPIPPSATSWERKMEWTPHTPRFKVPPTLRLTLPPPVKSPVKSGQGRSPNKSPKSPARSPGAASGKSPRSPISSVMSPGNSPDKSPVKRSPITGQSRIPMKSPLKSPENSPTGSLGKTASRITMKGSPMSPVRGPLKHPLVTEMRASDKIGVELRSSAYV